MRHRLVIALGVVAMTALAGYGIGKVGFDDNVRAVFRTDDEDYRLMEEVFDQFGADENDCYLIVESDNLFSNESIADLRKLTDDIAQLEGVESVFSIVERQMLSIHRRVALVPEKKDGLSPDELQRTRDEVLAHPLTRELLIDAKGNTTLVQVRLKSDTQTVTELGPPVKAVREVAARYSSDSSLNVKVTGVPAIRVDAFRFVREESQRFTILCALAAFGMAVVILRRWQMVIAVCVAALIGAFWTVGTLGLVGEDIHALTVVLPMLVMIVAFTDSVHLVVDVRHSRARGLSPAKASRDALRHLTAACALTSFTTAVGFASLAVTKAELVRRFGLACAMGAVMTFIAVIAIVPLVCSTRLGEGMLPAKTGRGLERVSARIGDWLIDKVLRFRWAISIFGVVAAIGMTFAAFQLEPDHEIEEGLPRNAESIVALHQVDDDFGGILPSFVVVDWPENVQPRSPEFRAALSDVHSVCIDSPAVNAPFSVLNFMEAYPIPDPETLPATVQKNLLQPKIRRAVVICRSVQRGAADQSRVFPELASQLAALEEKHPGFRFRLTGSTVVVSRNLGQMIVDLASSLGLASVVIFLTLTIVFRSVRIGLICLIPNALPLLFTAAILVWTGEPLRFAGVIVFCVCLGIAVDDTIHVINRFQRELRETGDVDEALRRSLQAVGSALLITTCVLVVGFSLTLTSEIPSNRLFGALSCIAIASALLGDLVVLPAMLACFVKRPKDVV